MLRQAQHDTSGVLQSPLLILLAFLVTSSGVYAQAVQSSTDSISGADLATRPIDIIKHDYRWNAASTDGFTYWLDAGLYGYHGSQPAILLDGIPVDISYFGWQNLNMLPVNTEHLKKISSRFTPQVYENTYSGSGLIDFISALPDSGWRATGSVFLGNETGDPGPWAYDPDRVTPNVDRWGPDAEAWLSYSNKGWYSKAGYTFRRHQQTDLISNRRLRIPMFFPDTGEFLSVITTTQSGLFETGYKARQWNVRSRLIAANDSDYLFLQAFGRELPVETEFKQFAMEGQFRPGKWKFMGRYVLDDKINGSRRNRFNYNFNWKQRSHMLSAKAGYSDLGDSLKAGLIAAWIRTRAPGLNHQNDRLYTFFIESRHAFSSRSLLHFRSNMDIHKTDIAPTVEMESALKFTRSWTFRPQLFYSQQLPLRRNSFPYWTSRGYNYDNVPGISFKDSLQVHKNRLLGFRSENQFRLSKRITFSLNQTLIHHYSLDIPWQAVEYDSQFDSRPGSFSLAAEKGTRLGLSAELTHSVESLLKQQLSVELQKMLEGTERYKAYWKQIPVSSFNYLLDIYPVRNLELSLNARYRTGTRWEEFEALEGETYRSAKQQYRPTFGTFDTQTPSYFNLSLSARKWFWKRRLSTLFSIRNLLNQEVRTHTMGADLALRFYVKVVLNL